jgi:hypothetical protein
MIRLARRALLLVVFSFLTSAATAYAECAWVMWEHRVTPSKGGSPTESWLAQEAVETRIHECPGCHTDLRTSCVVIRVCGR